MLENAVKGTLILSAGVVALGIAEGRIGPMLDRGRWNNRFPRGGRWFRQVVVVGLTIGAVVVASSLTSKVVPGGPAVQAKT